MRRLVPLLLLAAACQGDPTLTLGADPRDLDGDQGQDDGPGAGDDGANDGDDGGDGDDGDDGDDNDGCVSEVNSFGILCSTCPGRDRECIPADCTVQDSCLRCEDPAGREATDCSIDYDEVPIVQATLIADGAFNPCTMTWGDPTGSATTCRYPGFDDCVETDDEEGHCITCGTVRVCAAGPDDPLPDPFAERPDDLPPPNDGCSLIFSPDGEQICATCTREDGGATRICRHAPIETCVPESEADAGGCFDCRQADDDIESVCYPRFR